MPPRSQRKMIPLITKLLGLAVLVWLNHVMAPIPLGLGQLDSDFQPYTATVISQDALVHAGPAEVLYATDKLPVGQEVEVYRHDPGGWCAIRPPNGSFSMVLAQNIELLDDRTARVAVEGTKCWVGTTLGEVQEPLWQVKLRKGEKLRLIGIVREQYVLEDGQPDWIQIAPPSGEFRWIHESRLKYKAPLPLKSTEEKSPNRRSGSESFAENGRKSMLNEFSFTAEDQEFEDDDDRLSESFDNFMVEPGAHHSRPRFHPLNADEFDIVDGIVLEERTRSDTRGNHGANPERERLNDGVSGWRAAERPAAVFLNKDDSHANFQVIPLEGNPMPGVEEKTNPHVFANLDPNQPTSQAIQRLELELTRQAAQDPTQWQLVSIINECRHLIEHTQDAVERERAERLFAKTLQFQRIQAQHMPNSTQTLNAAVPTRIAALDTNRYTEPYDIYSANAGSATNTGSGSANNILGSNQTDAVTPSGSDPVLAGNYEVVGIINTLVRDNGRSKPTYVLQDDQGKIIYHVSAAPGHNLHRYVKKQVAIKGARGFHRQLNLPHITAEEIFEIRNSAR